jgi:YegS/Rv2252/BmrU family lipid kinase
MTGPVTRESPRTFVVVNPAAAGGSTGRRWDSIARTLRRQVGPFEHAFTEGPRDATVHARKALIDGFGLIVVVGGDGTVNEAACGFFDGQQPVAPGAALGIVPLGTGCDLARTVTSGRTLEEACARILAAPARSIDVGHVRFAGHDGRPAERVFLNEASFGCGGAVVHALKNGLKRFGGKLAFALTTARVLLRYRDQSVTVAVDGGPPRRLSVTNFAVCNGRYFGGGMQVAPMADPQDGLLDATIWSDFGVWEFVRLRRSLYDGTHVRHPGTTVFRLQRIEARSEEPVLLDVDGEAAGRLPIRIEVLPRALLFKG